jgi:ABC-type bacteriocin/lantibiotic exporter with double-glycine peptidase domain
LTQYDVYIEPFRFDVYVEVISIFRYVLRKMYTCRGSKVLTAIILVSFAVTAVAPALNGLFVDFLIYNKDIGKVVEFALIVAAVGVFGAILTYASGVISVRVTSETAFSVLADLVSRLEHASLEVVEGMETGYATQRISTDASAVTSFVIANFLSVALEGALAVFVIVVFAYADPWLVLFSSALVTAYITLFLRLKAPLYRTSLEKKEADSTFFDDISSQVGQVFDIQLRSDYDGSASRLGAAFDRYLPVVMSAGRVSYLFSSMDGIISAVFQAVILLFAGIQIVQGKMTVGELTMVNSYFAMLLQCTKYYIGFYKQYQDALASYGRIGSLAATPAPYTGECELKHVSEIELNGLNHSIHQEGVERELYGGLTYTFHQGMTYAVMGENGSGKSTLLKLLVGLYDSQGTVLYDGRPLSDLDMEKVRRRCFAVVPQALHATSQLVRDYVADRADVEPESAEGLLTLDSDVPGIARAVIGLLDKRCDSLSGGEIRKLCLWLALRRESDVLVLDEPSAGLDADGERELVEYIRENRRGQTIIIMTHDDELARTTQETLSL